MRYCSLNNIPDGARVARTVFSVEGTVLLQANTYLSDFLINRLKTLGYSGIYILDKISEGITLRETLPIYLQLEALQSVASRNIDNCIFLSNKIVDELSNNSTIQTDLSAISNHDNYTYMHSVNVAMFCGVVGIKMNLSYEQVKDLISAALLHDIGKCNIPTSILNKPGELTDEEYAIIKQHPTTGYNMLQSNTDISSKLRIAVYAHHENIDGSGYPRGIKGDDIYILARIIHVCDVYDALISERAYKKALCPNEVVEFLLGNCSTMFDEKIVKIFLDNLVIFPNGSMVKLSTGDEAIVIDNYLGYPLRPLVRTMDGEEINLKEINNITILDYVV